MAERKDKIAGLVFKWLKKDISAEEELQLNEWMDESESNRELFQKLTSEEDFNKDVQEIHHYKEKGWATIQAEFGNSEIRQFDNVIPIWKKMAVAACIILLLGLGTYFIFFSSSTSTDRTNTVAVNDVPAPKETRAVITLADGRKIYLDSAGNGTLVQQQGVEVVKNEGGEIVYQSTVDGQQSTVVYNSLFNPRGSKVVSLTLSDGTKVWLNSESSLKYPVAFNSNERKVEITGEAYFEVAKNKEKKFLVDANGVTTEVLGTHFNVNSYSDEDAVKVTLLEGSVRVSTVDSRQSTVIKPGQQAISANSQLSTVNGIDTDEVMAWKNGRFYFDGANIKTIMQQLSRWYNVDVEYKADIKSSFVAKISRDVPVSELLKIMELTNLVHFKIEGNKVTVMK